MLSNEKDLCKAYGWAAFPAVSTHARSTLDVMVSTMVRIEGESNIPSAPLQDHEALEWPSGAD